VSWENEGLKLEGIVTLPRPEIAKAPYKTLVFPHGGPHSRSVRGFSFVAQVFAARGYLVFEPNFRGSAGYGQAFIDADRFDFGGGDMRDLLSGVDFLDAIEKDRRGSRHRHVDHAAQPLLAPAPQNELCVRMDRLLVAHRLQPSPSAFGRGS